MPLPRCLNYQDQMADHHLRKTCRHPRDHPSGLNWSRSPESGPYLFRVSGKRAGVGCLLPVGDRWFSVIALFELPRSAKNADYASVRDIKWKPCGKIFRAPLIDVSGGGEDLDRRP